MSGIEQWLISLVVGTPTWQLIVSLIPAICALCTLVALYWHGMVVFLNVCAVIPPLKFLGTLASWMSVNEATIDNDTSAIITFVSQFSLKSLPMKK